MMGAELDYLPIMHGILKDSEHNYFHVQRLSFFSNFWVAVSSLGEACLRCVAHSVCTPHELRRIKQLTFGSHSQIHIGGEQRLPLLKVILTTHLQLNL